MVRSFLVILCLAFCGGAWAQTDAQADSQTSPAPLSEMRHTIENMRSTVAALPESAEKTSLMAQLTLLQRQVELLEQNLESKWNDRFRSMPTRRPRRSEFYMPESGEADNLD